jgi:hypothetical protein
MRGSAARAVAGASGRCLHSSRSAARDAGKAAVAGGSQLKLSLYDMASDNPLDLPRLPIPPLEATVQRSGFRLAVQRLKLGASAVSALIARHRWSQGTVSPLPNSTSIDSQFLKQHCPPYESLPLPLRIPLRWLASLEPHASSSELARVQKLANEFLAGDGAYLHAQLIKQDARDAKFEGGGHYPYSYIERFWYV